MRLSLTCLQRRVGGRVLLLVLYTMTAAILLLQTRPLLTSVFRTFRDATNIPTDAASTVRYALQNRRDNKEDGHDAEHVDKRWFNPPDCSVLDFMSGPDPSARTVYNSSIFCGPEARNKDVFCRMFFSQQFTSSWGLLVIVMPVSECENVGLHEDGDCVRETDDTKVPRIVYYVIFGDYTFKFWNYVSLMASKRHIKPSALYVVGDAHPVGYWWTRVMRDIKGVRFVYR
ncbi:hypothetical protein BaRGS_00009908 [Batillaria attramentaria]|uniref:Fucosyltransferase n=1 Tax=Batillaria attramentaria TaxID=370345 RepID=A0ABD0LHS2_9CAEN